MTGEGNDLIVSVKIECNAEEVATTKENVKIGARKLRCTTKAEKNLNDPERATLIRNR